MEGTERDTVCKDKDDDPNAKGTRAQDDDNNGQEAQRRYCAHTQVRFMGDLDTNLNK